MTKTEQLRKEIDQLIPYGPLMPSETPDVVTNQILKACKEAGLAFVVEDAELPRNLWGGDFGYGYGQARKDMLKAGYRQTAAIEL